MRLLLWASSYGQTIGGGPVLAPLLVAGLARRGHQIVVLTDRRPMTLPGEEDRDGARILRPPLRQALAGDMAAFRDVRDRVASIKRELRPDVVHIFTPGYGDIFHHLTAAISPAPLVVSLHDRFPASYYRPEALIGRDLRAADWITACSAAVLATARQHVPQIIGRSVAILNALPQPPTAREVQAHDPHRILYAGRLVGKKGVDILLAAFATLKDRYPAIMLDVAGDGPERPALTAAASRLSIAHRVVFHGSLPRDAVYALMGRSGLVVVPSRIEPFGLVALEAAQIARPVVAGDVDGLPEVVVDGETGLLVRPDDAAALAAAIAALLDAPERAIAMGKAAQRRALEYFPWDGFVDAYEEIFRRLAR